MNDVRKCVQFYSGLMNKSYIFTLEGDITFKLLFRERNFVHLLGLHKLKDIEELNKNKNAEKIYKDILSGELSHDTICKSKFYHLIAERITYFKEIEICSMLTNAKSLLILTETSNKN